MESNINHYKNDNQLYRQITSLPVELKQEVWDFIDFLKHKRKTVHKIKARKPGMAKGLIEISSDFDEPMEDFKEYM